MLWLLEEMKMNKTIWVVGNSIDKRGLMHAFFISC